MEKDTSTSRAIWEEISNETQTMVNEVLAELQTEIDAANVIISDKLANEADDVSEYIDGVVEYLDSKWPFAYDYFMVSGTWLEPIIGMNEEGVQVRHARASAFAVARSNGFVGTVESMSDYHERYVGLSFIAAELAHATPTMQGKFSALALSDPREVSLQYLRSNNTSAASSTVEEVELALHRADALLDLYTNHEASSFFKQSAKKQEKFIRSVIDSVENILPAPDSLEATYVENCTSPEMYYWDASNRQMVYIKAESEERPFSLSGKIVGVTLTDSVEDGYGRKYTSPDEFGTTGSGLSLIVQPMSANFDMSIFKGQDLLIPMRSIDNMSIGIG